MGGVRDRLQRAGGVWAEPPLLTTICRSNRDGYAPRNETGAVEAAVLRGLAAMGWASSGLEGTAGKAEADPRLLGSLLAEGEAHAEL